jgi:ATP-dependent protease HslVU (ClpYQ) peptidase subunit
VSVVAARLYGDRLEIAADSVCIRWATQTTDNKKHSKLWQRGDLVIGGVGTAQENGLMRLFSENHQPETSDERGLLAFMSEFAEWKKRRTETYAIENHYLLGCGAGLFHLEGFGIDQVTTYEAIGAGMDYALAAMRCGADPKTAVETAIDLSIYCAAPVQIITRPVPWGAK